MLENNTTDGFRTFLYIGKYPLEVRHVWEMYILKVKPHVCISAYIVPHLYTEWLLMNPSAYQSPLYSLNSLATLWATQNNDFLDLTCTKICPHFNGHPHWGPVTQIPFSWSNHSDQHRTLTLLDLPCIKMCSLFLGHPLWATKIANCTIFT